MKKYLLLIILLLVPFMVHAKDEVKITDVELVTKSETAVVLEEPTYEGLNIDFNLKFKELNDKVVYKIKVKNDTKKDYEMYEGTKFNEGKYLKYEFKILNDNKDLKSGQTKEIEITITYVEGVELDTFENRKYNEDNHMSISLSDVTKNPNTYTLPILIIAIALIALIAFLITHHKTKSLMFILIAFLLIPITIKAIEKLELNVNTKVVIEQKCTKLILESEGSFSNTEELKEICIFFDDTGEEYENHYIVTFYSNEFLDDPYTDVSNKVFFAPETIGANTFNDDSYIRVYSDNTKQDLLLEITKDNFTFINYNLNLENMDGYPTYNDGTFELFFEIGDAEDLNIEDIYVEASQDLIDLFDEEHYSEIVEPGYILRSEPIHYRLITKSDETFTALIEGESTSGLWMDEDGREKTRILEEMIYEKYPVARRYGISFGYEEVEGEYNTYYFYWSARLDPL